MSQDPAQQTPPILLSSRRKPESTEPSAATTGGDEEAPPPAYAELQVTSNFSFLRGGSKPAELVDTAAALGYRAIAVTDRNSVAGIVRAWDAAVAAGMQFLVGCRLDFQDMPSVLAYPVDLEAYGNLCTLLTVGKRRAPKAQCWLTRADLSQHGDGLVIVALPPDETGMPEPPAGFAEHLDLLHERFGGDLYLAVTHRYGGDDVQRLAALARLADPRGIKLVATNDVLYHVPARRPLQDVLTCIREGCTIGEAGSRLAANAERCLKTVQEMARLFRTRPDAIRHTIEIAERCTFTLKELKYEYPAEPVPDGMTPQQALEAKVWEHLPAAVGDQEVLRPKLDYELKLIAELGYAAYFLTVYDIVQWARSKEILCQGRGSAANSVVCYVLGITSIGPDKIEALFERFVSPERREPPDIDVDFEHERREEVIQRIYEKYGRDRAALTATLITYRPRSAIRDVGKAMGLAPDTIETLARTLWGWGRDGIQAEYVREAGLDPDEPQIQRTLALTQALLGFPRHLSQHVGGFVISRGPLHRMVPIENAAMDDRTVIEWDKDDLDTVGMLKIDVLALGMLTCLQKGFSLLRQYKQLDLTLATLPHEDPATYEMLQQADSVGLFQVESRAQMAMLPRLKPACFYDLVIQVAIVRPGPIQGDMVHPYLRRRSKEEPVEYPSDALKAVLEKTCGVPLFQEQAMQIAIVAAGFTPSEANQLRKAMATFRHSGTIHTLEKRLIEGMVANGYEKQFAERCFRQIEGFGEYGFPESHAASFALLVYASAWMKCHHPDVFAAAILNSQPLGFYAPAQLVRDAREHQVEVRPVDVEISDWDNTLEPTGKRMSALRLGLRQIKGLSEKEAVQLVQARTANGGSFGDMATLQRLVTPSAPAFAALANADAFVSLGPERRAALWHAQGETPGQQPALAPSNAAVEPRVLLPAAPLAEAVMEDYAHLRLSLRAHPISFLRPGLERCVLNEMLQKTPTGRLVRVAGLVLIRQQPGTSSGVIFVTLEDETGVANLVVWPRVFERFRRTLLDSRAMEVRGRVQREGIVVHVVAEELIDLSPALRGLASAPDSSMPPSRDFH